MATAKTISKAPAQKPAAKTAAPASAATPKAVAATPKAPAPVHYKTPSGFECDISPAVWDDMEVLDLFVEMSTGDDTTAGLAVPRLLAKIFTPEQKRAFYDHVRTPDGRVPIEPVTVEIMALINALGGDSKK